VSKKNTEQDSFHKFKPGNLAKQATLKAFNRFRKGPGIRNFPKSINNDAGKQTAGDRCIISLTDYFFNQHLCLALQRQQVHARCQRFHVKDDLFDGLVPAEIGLLQDASVDIGKP
jgi:hypothetical protein